jgi:hypothetical protein
MGEERASMGVKPSVEVKRPETPEPLEVENLIERKDPENQDPKAEPSPSATPKQKSPVIREDVQLKKALELMAGKSQGKAAGN